MTVNFNRDQPSILMGVQYSTVLASFNVALTDSNLTRGISVDADGTVNIEYKNGSTDTLTLASGVEHAIVGFTKIVSSSLTTSQIHILY